MELNQNSQSTAYNRYPEIFKEVKTIIPQTESNFVIWMFYWIRM